MFISTFGITLPDPSSVMATTGVWSTAMFDEVLPIVMVVAGFAIAGLFGYFVMTFFFTRGDNAKPWKDPAVKKHYPGWTKQDFKRGRKPWKKDW